MVYFELILHTYTFLHCLDTGKHVGDAALPSISPADRELRLCRASVRPIVIC